MKPLQSNGTHAQQMLESRTLQKQLAGYFFIAA